jgi:Ca-activated chloride channel family protein
MVSNQGTNIGAAIDLATRVFTSSSADSRVIVLITDGENHGDDAIVAAKHASKLGINIYVVGIGTPEGAPIRIDGEYLKDDQGQMVVSKLDEQGLQQIALSTNGAYIRAERTNLGLDDIVNRINATHEAALQQVEFERYNELYPYPLTLALLLLLAEFAMLLRKNRWLSKIKLFS